jgi:sterol desaturase/sphingolipid hydroxylase (fatty acid hydroxylase superfamily)
MERIVHAQAFFSYLVYPVVVLGGGAAVVWALERGVPAAVAVGAVTVAAAAGVTALERLLPYEPSWNRSAGDAAADATHYVVNLAIKQSALALYGALVARVALFADVWPHSWPLAAQALLALALFDASLYGVHRWSHANRVLWRLHAVHHASRRLYWVNGEKRHPLHQILEGLPGVTALMLVGAPQIALVGALATLGLNMMLQHGNVDYRAGWLRYLFSVAELHRWHHRRDAAESRVNFGAFFAVWDLLFGTYFDDRRRVPVRDVGVDERPAVPDNYAGQLAWPFRASETERPG